MACNDAGLCLIATRDLAIAKFVDQASQGVPPDLRLTVGGDPGTSQHRNPIFYHIRRYSK